MTDTPLVRLIGLGGTIAMDTGSSGGLEPRRGAAELGSLVSADGGVPLVTEDFRKVPGASLTMDDAVALASRIREHIDEGADGIVVTQGTDTLEEVAFVADLLLEAGDVPVVFTGAMIPPHLPGTDAPSNLRDAVAVASSGRQFGGVVVVFGGHVLPARHVRKRHTISTAAFDAAHGSLGDVVEGAVRQRAVLPPSPLRPLLPTGPLPYVHLHRVALGDDGRMLDGLAQRDVSGLVVEGFGAGHVPQACVPALAKAAAAMPTVLTSRTGGGFGLRDTYGFPGSERDLLGHGLIWAGDLDGPKSRVLLTLLLAAGHDRDRIARSFAAWAG